MARWFGEIGFTGTVNDKPGIWTEQVAFRKNYFGEILQSQRRYGASNQVVDDVTVTSKISVLADDFAISNIPRMKYVEYLGVKWIISQVEPRYPRLILTLGGEYTGDQTT